MFQHKAKISPDELTATKFLSVCCMILLLVFLTGINYFLYPDKESPNPAIIMADGSGTEDLPSNNFPGGPDEKSPDTPVGISEEYVHAHGQELSPFWTNAIFSNLIHEAEKLCMVHYDLFSPPPEA